MEGKPDYSGMTVNERLFSAGLMADWDGAAQSRNRKRMVELLTKVDLEDEADQIVDTILSNPQRYGFCAAVTLIETLHDVLKHTAAFSAAEAGAVTCPLLVLFELAEANLRTCAEPVTVPVSSPVAAL